MPKNKKGITALVRDPFKWEIAYNGRVIGAAINEGDADAFLRGLEVAFPDCAGKFIRVKIKE